MKYFTPDLMARNQSEDNAVQNEVEAIWEVRIEEYDRYLAGVKHLFTPGLKMVFDGYYLHDADVHGIARHGDQLVFFIQFDTVQRTFLVLRYDLVEEPRIDRDALPDVARIGGLPMWQYDEVELVGGDPPTWRHSILLSNGWEMTLHVRDVQAEELDALLPGPREISVTRPTELPQTA